MRELGIIFVFLELFKLHIERYFLMKKKFNWQQYLDKGNFYLNHFEYYEAKKEFSKIIDNNHTPTAWKREAKFLNSIANFHLKKNNTWKDFFLNLREEEYSSFQKSFLYILHETLKQNRYEYAITVIQKSLRRYPPYIEKYKNLLIHLPLDFQIIFKMSFY